MNKQPKTPFIRVGKTYYKIIVVTDLNKNKETVLKQWHKTFVKEDLEGDKELFKSIPEYFEFCSLPNNTKTYSRDVESMKGKLYNLYNPLNHNLKQGQFPNIEKFLHRIFDIKNISGTSMYNFIIDYLTILFKYPSQRLPILCLTSNERNTGKTTFLEFLKLIFKANCAILDNNDFMSIFTRKLIAKLLLCIDESFIDADNKILIKRIKSIQTCDVHTYEEKGADPFQLRNISKLIISSNDPSNFDNLAKYIDGLSIIKFQKIKDEDVNPNILKLLKSEIPAFLYFLNNRETTFEVLISRHCFKPEVFTTHKIINIDECFKPDEQKQMKERIKKLNTNTKTNKIISPSPSFSVGDIIFQSEKYRFKNEPKHFKVLKVFFHKGKFEYHLSALNSKLETDKRRSNITYEFNDDVLITEFSRI